MSAPTTPAPVTIDRHFTADGEDPYETTEWTRSTATLGDFNQANVEHPVSWRPSAVGVAAKLYFATVDGVKEDTVRRMIGRVADKITNEGVTHGYFPASDDGWSEPAATFHAELSWLLLNQRMAFNTPVWLNLGVPGRKQCASACFLNKVEDTMLGERFGGKGDHSIMDLVAAEAAIFKMGAGSGANISPLRGSMEKLSTGGTASGPPSYGRLLDANAGTLKSGGAHRRAAKMVILDDDHPDIMDFAGVKRREDDRMRALRDAGFEINPFTASGEKTIAECTTAQNANLSIGACDEFMHRAFGDDGHAPEWALTARTTGDTIETIIAKDLLDFAVDAAWRCGDPGWVFRDRANEWHTTPMLRGKRSPITTCNPCAETWLNDDSACNLASLNILAFMDEHGALLVEDFCRAIDVTALAMDITCSFSDTPTEYITRNTRELRQLGLGYANLGAAIMCKGYAYDSDEGRDFAGAITALMTGRTYRQSALLAQSMGPYACFAENRDSHLNVIAKHRGHLQPGDASRVWMAANNAWSDAEALGRRYGYRNAQATVIAPTGTTRWLMGCDTSGAEPDFSLVHDKGLAGGGTMRVVNGSVTRALGVLGYTYDDVKIGIDYLTSGDTEAFLATLNPDHRPVFDCANDISPDGHIDMVCAIQPFVSGAPSKTVNLAESATRDDIRHCIERAWRGGAKCISIFRDGSKVTAIMTHVTKDGAEVVADVPGELPAAGPVRRRLPGTRPADVHKFRVGEHEGYLTVSRYPDTQDMGEMFLTGVGKEGSFLQGMMNMWSIAVSVGLQYGVPLEVFVDKSVGVEFEPRGATGNPDIPYASSFPDYIFRWIAQRFLDIDAQEAVGVLSPEIKARMTARLDAAEAGTAVAVHTVAVPSNGNGHAPSARGQRMCACGGIMRLTGTCWTCLRDPSHNTGCG